MKDNLCDRPLLVLFLSYGALILTGGLIGYILKNSMPSLISGTLFSFFIFALSLFYWKNRPVALKGLVVIASFLFLFFCYRYSHSFQFFPAGMMAILSLFMLVMTYFRNKTRWPSKPLNQTK
ncbi:TMEM14 family protein [Criblamydia sequanensis]|uniref:Membrane protein n=1 Tax=Candidatus Criblamydia sequanensis CRIB-18 TaxID=1437425 RepID=A0A090D2W1_9BACT|nr:TMEM14 family protein [Criblamydia sequanensis]CDR34995.1 putative membrane protein [Criblamydia sequanensis CRIB-18]